MGRKKKYSHSISQIWQCWVNMNARCHDPNHPQYIDYGARGVIVCKKWRERYQSFLTWALNNGWRKGLQLDKDINGDGMLYSPKKCSWVTAKENSNKKRNCLIFDYKGEKKTVSQICEGLGISPFRIYVRLKNGMSLEEAIKMPIRARNNIGLVEYCGEFMTFKEISRRTGAYYPQLVHNFRKRNLSIVDAIKESTHAE